MKATLLFCVVLALFALVSATYLGRVHGRGFESPWDTVRWDDSVFAVVGPANSDDEVWVTMGAEEEHHASSINFVSETSGTEQAFQLSEGDMEPWEIPMRVTWGRMEQEKLKGDEAKDGKEEFRKEARSRYVVEEGEAKKGEAESEANDKVKKEDVEGVDKEEASDVSCDKNEDEEQLMTGEDDLVEKQKYVNTKRRGRGSYKLDMWKYDARSISLDNSTDPKGKPSNLRESKLVTITLAQDLKCISSKLGKVVGAKMVTNAKTLGAQSSTSPSSTEGSVKTVVNCSKEKRLQRG
ncbi:hypothetical protein GE061_018844 [Apolygus lucorum]|uniref:Uncharacterized protein n=1 Tax=Apolygus lucorum TaxID=248454 RepID=A0A8S9X6T7_APOLU|nr:hypothetical protein GE061_018844 [Apolygus lucorum]